MSRRSVSLSLMVAMLTLLTACGSDRWEDQNSVWYQYDARWAVASAGDSGHK